MDKYNIFPDAPLASTSPVSAQFFKLGIDTFHLACRWVHALPYGYDADRDDLMTLFK
jgi:hypothetical protein